MVWLLLIPINGVPCTLLTFILFPNAKGTKAESTFPLSLGFSTSNIVVPALSISNPLTYALPGDTLTAIKSSVGSIPWSVFWSDLNTPSFDKPSFNELATWTPKPSTV